MDLDTRTQALFSRFLEQDPDTSALAELVQEASEDMRGPLRECIDTVRGLEDRLDIPPQFGDYAVVGKLGQGGVGTVLLARHKEIGQKVAIKVLSKDDRRTLHEAKALARLRHDGVIRVLGVGEEGGRNYVILEHASGPPLDQIIAELRRRRDGIPLQGDDTVLRLVNKLEPLRSRVAFLRKLAAAISHCHQREVVHRDIKPENIVLDGAGNPKLVDFDLAHLKSGSGFLQEDGSFRGSRGYLSPEQVDRMTTGSSYFSDQFSLCVVAYELLSLENPYRADPIQAPSSCSPRSLETFGVPAPLARVVEKGLEKSPDQRHPSVDHLGEDLHAFLDNRPLRSTKTTMMHRIRLFARRNKVLLGAIATTILLGLLSLAASKYRDRLQLLDEIQDVTFDESMSPEDLLQRGRELDLLKSRTEGLPVPYLPRGIDSAAEARLDAWSQVAGAAFRSAPHHESESNAWRVLFAFERAVCPESTHNRDIHSRGKVTLPIHKLEGLDWQLQAMVQPEHPRNALVPEFVAIDPERPLQVGTYRVVAFSRAGLVPTFERLFSLDLGWGPAVDVDLNPRNLELYSSAARVERTVIDQGLSSEFTVPAVRISPLVSAAAVRTFLETTGHRAAWVEADEEGTAIVDRATAEAYCTWAGGRLPSCEESWLGYGAGVLGEPSSWIQGEWTCNGYAGPAGQAPTPTGFLPLSTYFVRREASSDPRGSYSDGGFGSQLSYSPTGKPVGISFRVAFGADNRELYLSRP